MPTYDYQCTKCQHSFEAFQRISEDPLTKCPECGGKIKRLIGGGVGIIFKGSGFYVTDNRSGSANGGSTKKSSDNGKSDTSSKSDSKSETKSDTKKESKKETKSSA